MILDNRVHVGEAIQRSPNSPPDVDEIALPGHTRGRPFSNLEPNTARSKFAGQFGVGDDLLLESAIRRGIACRRAGVVAIQARDVDVRSIERRPGACNVLVAGVECQVFANSWRLPWTGDAQVDSLISSAAARCAISSLVQATSYRVQKPNFTRAPSVC